MTHNGDKELVHKYWIRANEKICLDWMNGTCDELGRDPKEYPKVIRIASVYEFIYPIVSFFICGFAINQFIFSFLISAFAVIYIPFLPLIVGYNLTMVIVFVIIGVAIDISYYYYLYKKIGIYVTIPMIGFGLQFLFGLIPFVGVIISVFIGLIPWSVMALGTHLIHYQAGIGIVFNADKRLYVKQEKKDDFYLEW